MSSAWRMLCVRAECRWRCSRFITARRGLRTRLGPSALPSTWRARRGGAPGPRRLPAHGSRWRRRRGTAQGGRAPAPARRA
eukprot:5332642-Pyramimonas_sp.AAC.1